jgi:hypothetical protein
MGTSRTGTRRKYEVTITPKGGGEPVTGSYGFFAPPTVGQSVLLSTGPGRSRVHATVTAVHSRPRPATAHPETAGNAGLIRTVRSRQTGNLISLYRSAEARIEDDPDPDLRYAMVCEAHGGVTCVATRARGLAELPYPNDWCPTCQEIVELAAKEAQQAAGDTSVILAERIIELRRLIALASPTSKDGAR